MTTHEENRKISLDEQIELNPKLGVVIWKHNFDNIADAMHDLVYNKHFRGAIESWNEALLALWNVADSLDTHFDSVEKVGWTRKKQQFLKDVICGIPSILHSELNSTYYVEHGVPSDQSEKGND